ncbi:phage minor head protein [Alkalicoccobacillus gibsonii]|uniref:phage minor head protein n=1 Tax=Alkalicoccobacillus gibsonii TaxID=79881 RepID=UPI001931B4C2|nr:phage minor head protein [Alkalicoccobacillus gibsonii]MBM0064938.1 hypothetical protein [Alkalicoccobacillus gibsonii]
MADVFQLIKNINSFIRKETEDDQSLGDDLPDFPGKDKVEQLVEDFETTVARLLRRQRKRYLDVLRSFVAKDDTETLQAILTYLQSEFFDADLFAAELAEEASRFLRMTVEEFAGVIMDAIDQDIQFEVLSSRSTSWIEEWSEELGELMQTSTQKSVEKILVEGIKEGHGIDKIEAELAELPDFSRDRARKTAITEVLTASSVAHQESFSQSPAVTGKRWKHSGVKSITPRQNHMALDGTVVGVDEDFEIPDSGELAQHPRDTKLSAKERINCHCVLGPVVDEDIFGLSKEEKEEIRRQALEELGVA